MSRKPGKRINYLTLDVDGMYYKVELRAQTGMHSEQLHLVMDDLPMHLTGTDIKDLKERAKQFIRERCAVPWERWIEIQINDPEHYHSNRMNYRIDVEWREFEQGVTPSGTKAHREGQGSYSHNGWLSERRTPGFTYVRSTPELVAALKEIGKRIEETRKRLERLLKPGTIKDLPELVQKALPAPVEKSP